MRAVEEDAISALPDEDREEKAILDFPEKDRELARLLIEAARDEIHQDSEKAQSERYKELLLYIKNWLTSPLLDVKTARNAAGLRGTNIYAREFARITGTNPSSYIERRRMGLARKLWRYTRADIYCIAFAVSYEDGNYFSKRFKKFAGHPPTAEPRADSQETELLLERLRKEAEAKRQQISDHASNGLQVSPPGDVSARTEGGVNAFWEEIRGLDRDQIIDYFHNNGRVIDVHHFDFLLEKSKLAGRRSRERGEEIALIALDCLRAIELRKGRDLLDEKVLSHAVLANARRLRLDFVGAQDAFQFIDKIKEEKLRPELLLQVNISRAQLLWWWKRDVSRSIKTVETLLSEARSHASSELLAITLDLAGQIYETIGRTDDALAMYEEVVEQSRFIDDPYVTFGAHYNVATMYSSLSNGKKASELFKKVRQLYEEANDSSLGVYVTLLAARVHRSNGNLRDCEPAFLKAREGFAGFSLDIYVALTSLELALLYLELAKPDRAFSMAIGSIDCISRYSYHKEAMTALAVLQEASRTATINKAMLRRAWRHVELIRKDPTSALWAQ